MVGKIKGHPFSLALGGWQVKPIRPSASLQMHNGLKHFPISESTGVLWTILLDFFIIFPSKTHAFLQKRILIRCGN